MQRLYDWLVDEQRKPAQTFFTSGELRNVAKEIEFRLSQQYPAEFVEWVLQNYTPVKSLTAYAWWDKVIGSDNYFTTAQLYKHWKENIQSQSK